MCHNPADQYLTLHYHNNFTFSKTYTHNTNINASTYHDCKVKWSRYRPSVAQRVGRGIALLFHDCGTRRGWVVRSTPRPHFTPGKDLVPILQEAEWAPGPVWTGGKSRPHWDSIPDRPARSQYYDNKVCWNFSSKLWNINRLTEQFLCTRNVLLPKQLTSSAVPNLSKAICDRL